MLETRPSLGGCWFEAASVLLPSQSLHPHTACCCSGVWEGWRRRHDLRSPCLILVHSPPGLVLGFGEGALIFAWFCTN